MPTELMTMTFASADDLWTWLTVHHDDHPGLWVALPKAGNPTLSIGFHDLLEAGIAFGWSESTRRRLDDRFYLQRFTPRRRRGTASARNRQIASRLEAEGRMTDAGRHALGLPAAAR